MRQGECMYERDKENVCEKEKEIMRHWEWVIMRMRQRECVWIRETERMCVSKRETERMCASKRDRKNMQEKN